MLLVLPTGHIRSLPVSFVHVFTQNIETSPPIPLTLCLFPLLLIWVIFRIITLESSSCQTAVVAMTAKVTGRWTERQTKDLMDWPDSDSEQSRSISPSVIFSLSAVSESIHRNINTLLGKENHRAAFHCILMVISPHVKFQLKWGNGVKSTFYSVAPKKLWLKILPLFPYFPLAHIMPAKLVSGSIF